MESSIRTKLFAASVVLVLLGGAAGYGGFGLSLLWIIWLVVGILVAVWLWQQITRRSHDNK